VSEYSEKFCEEPERTFPTRAVVWSVAALVILLSLAWFFWPVVTRTIITHDLRQYSTVIREAELDVDAKIRLLDQIDDLEGKIQQGNKTSLWRWYSTDAAIRSLLSREINDEEVRLVERELRQVEDRLK